MKFECVNFNDEAVAAMSRSEFINTHIDVLWLDRDKDTRKKMLGTVYDLIKPAKKKGSK